MSRNTSPRLQRTLGLFDVYAVSTGAMFSSGFFLLPGIAAAATGPSVVWAYLLAAVLMVPAMLSVAELSTAMPKAGGAYFFMDRSLGPMAGTVGGLGSWIALVLKSAFALVGMGAYLGLFLEVPITGLAVALTIVFGLVNLLGAKETAGLQRLLVAALLVIMVYVLAEGVTALVGTKAWQQPHLESWLTHGVGGLFGTVGLVFVSYAGLTKVASVAEEIHQPERNIPLGMILALVSTTLVYCGGVLLMVFFVQPDVFYGDLTPVATAVSAVNHWLPETIAVGLVVTAALAAFASTGNAGIMAASRYLLAMARDRLVSPRLGNLGRTGTPHWSIAATVGIMILILLTVNIEQIAKMASAFQLLIFGLMNLAVIILRESRIPVYDPGFRSPGYPWIQIAGMLISVWLIAEMGLGPVAFTGTLAVISIGWYFFYAAPHISRTGAIYHIHERLGRRKDTGLEEELRDILQQQQLREQDPYESMIARATFIENARSKALSTDELLHKTADVWAGRLQTEKRLILEMLQRRDREHWVELTAGVMLIHVGWENLDDPELVIVRNSPQGRGPQKWHTLLFLLYPAQKQGVHLRMLGHLAESIDDADFEKRWRDARGEQEIKELLLRDDRFIVIQLDTDIPSAAWIDHKVSTIELPGDSHIAAVYRKGHWFMPNGNTELNMNDRLFIIGSPKAVGTLRDQSALPLN